MTRTEPALARFPQLDVSPQAELALLARVLYNEGYDDHLSGHITYKQPDGTFLVNPWCLTWDELTASDVCRMDAEGKQLEGQWEISKAVMLHIVLHQKREAGVVVHNHPRWGTIWADAQRAPGIYDQTSAMWAGELAIHTTYEGAVNSPTNASDVVDALGTADVALLGNHGVMILGKTITEAYMRSMVLEWRCRQAWHVEALGTGVPMDRGVVDTLRDLIDSHPTAFDGHFEAMARRVIRRDPGVLD